jgi:uncharacterized protein (AIM24 family)
MFKSLSASSPTSWRYVRLCVCALDRWPFLILFVYGADDGVQGCCGGSGFFLLEIRGTGTVFMLGGGSIMEKILTEKETLLVDSHSLVAFTESVHFDVRTAGGCTAMCCGGEGMFNTALTGPGAFYS